MTKGEDDKKEVIVKGMKKSFKGFRERYGPDAKSVMYATATKLAKEEVIDERLGGKGYKPYTSMSGEKVSGDWEDSDRGAGNKAKKRSGGKVEKKSPTYQAYVRNKIKEQLAPHIKKGVAAAKPLVKAQALQTGLPTKEKPKPPEKKDSKSIFSQLTNKDEID